MTHYNGSIPDTATRTADWLATAPCSADPEAMFPGTVAHEIENAKAYCRRCPAIQRCRDWAIDTREMHGVWGGLDEDERWEILRNEGRNGRRPAQQERGPKRPPPASLKELFDRHANPSTAGHLMWIGAKTPIFRGRQLTPGQVAFMADRSREPDGPVQRTCEVRGCVQPKHLADDVERQRTKAVG